MAEVRPLAFDEGEIAIDLMLPIAREIPFHQWLLGEAAGDIEVERWLIELQLIEHLRQGYVLGGFDGDELVGILMWSPAEPYVASPEPEFQERSIELLQHHPGIVERLSEFRSSSTAGRLAPPNIEIVLAGYTPRMRGTDLAAALVAPAFEAAREAGSCVWMGTAAESFGASAMRRFGGEKVGEYMVGPVTMHVYRTANVA